MAATGGSHLSNGRVNVGLLRECARRELLQCLNKQPGSKALVWDDKLTGPFGLIAEYKLLKEHEVEVMFPLRPGRLPPSQVHNVIFITRPKPSLMDIIANNVLSEEGKTESKKKEFTILFVPRKTLLCQRKLEEWKVSFINIDEYPLELIPLDSDVLSLEMESSFKECYLENDSTSLFYVANSLMTLQTLYGTIPKIYAKGDMSKLVLDMMMRKKREAADAENQVSPQIDTLLLIDRNIDLLTPLFTQLTYEGLIDELYGIHHTTAKFPPERFPQTEEKGPGGLQQQQPTGPKKVVLNSSDELFYDIRDLNFSAVGIHLSRKAKQISAAFEEHKSAKTVGEMKQYVQRIPFMQRAKASLATHTTIAEMVKEQTDSEEFRERIQVEQELAQGLDTDKTNPYIEKCFGLKKPLITVLRLLCAQCLTNNGFKPKMLEFYYREILQTYGFEHTYRTLSTLETAGLLRAQTQPSRSYNQLRKSMRLVVEDVQEQNPNDIAYVFSGYASLTVRLAQFLARPQGWRGLEEVLRLLPGPAVEEVQRLPPGLQKRPSTGVDSSMDGPPKVTLVFFIGGCTHAEISALRFLTQQENNTTIAELIKEKTDSEEFRKRIQVEQDY
ncbi:vacuolar protein sorting-associated protein 33A isoform X2 [Pocillopora verrucosa]|uniref:vacuolar protein sorting-associated protein 33A isoform X2 n=1 Tax=Pocillopora verrucosa TaxID=203993 RepID=UPI0033400FB5